MAATAQQVIDYARTTWGNYRDNAGRKVWGLYAPMDYTPASYCGAGQGLLIKHFELDYAPTTHERIIYVPYVVEDARKANLWIPSKQAKPGDWVICAWGNGYNTAPAYKADHIEVLVHQNPAQATVTTFGFNTSAPDGSLPRGAFLRVRDRDDIMGCVDRQHAYTAAGRPPPPPKPGLLAVDGWAGPATAKALGASDGVISGQPLTVKPYLWAWPSVEYQRSNPSGSLAIAKLQRKLGVKDDGWMGPGSMKALQRKLGVTADGYGGNTTNRALQTALNEGKL